MRTYVRRFYYATKQLWGAVCGYAAVKTGNTPILCGIAVGPPPGQVPGEDREAAAYRSLDGALGGGQPRVDGSDARFDHSSGYAAGDAVDEEVGPVAAEGAQEYLTHYHSRRPAIVDCFSIIYGVIFTCPSFGTMVDISH